MTRMTPQTIIEVSLKKSTTGIGWYIDVRTQDDTVRSVTPSAIIDPTVAAAEAARWTLRLLLGREY